MVKLEKVHKIKAKLIYRAYRSIERQIDKRIKQAVRKYEDRIYLSGDFISHYDKDRLTSVLHKYQREGYKVNHIGNSFAYSKYIFDEYSNLSWCKLDKPILSFREYCNKFVPIENCRGVEIKW